MRPGMLPDVIHSERASAQDGRATAAWPDIEANVSRTKTSRKGRSCITIDAFRIAGGIIFFGVGLDMLIAVQFIVDSARPILVEILRRSVEP